MTTAKSGTVVSAAKATGMKAFTEFWQSLPNAPKTSLDHVDRLAFMQWLLGEQTVDDMEDHDVDELFSDIYNQWSGHRHAPDLRAEDLQILFKAHPDWQFAYFKSLVAFNIFQLNQSQWDALRGMISEQSIGAWLRGKAMPSSKSIQRAFVELGIDLLAGHYDHANLFHQKAANPKQKKQTKKSKEDDAMKMKNTQPQAIAPIKTVAVKKPAAKKPAAKAKAVEKPVLKKAVATKPKAKGRLSPKRTAHDDAPLAVKTADVVKELPISPESNLFLETLDVRKHEHCPHLFNDFVSCLERITTIPDDNDAGKSDREYALEAYQSALRAPNMISIMTMWPDFGHHLVMNGAFIDCLVLEFYKLKISVYESRITVQVPIGEGFATYSKPTPTSSLRNCMNHVFDYFDTLGDDEEYATGGTIGELLDSAGFLIEKRQITLGFQSAVEIEADSTENIAAFYSLDNREPTIDVDGDQLPLRKILSMVGHVSRNVQASYEDNGAVIISGVSPDQDFEIEASLIGYAQNRSHGVYPAAAPLSAMPEFLKTAQGRRELLSFGLWFDAETNTLHIPYDEAVLDDLNPQLAVSKIVFL